MKSIAYCYFYLGNSVDEKSKAGSNLSIGEGFWDSYQAALLALTLSFNQMIHQAHGYLSYFNPLMIGMVLASRIVIALICFLSPVWYPITYLIRSREGKLTNKADKPKAHSSGDSPVLPDKFTCDASKAPSSKLNFAELRKQSDLRSFFKDHPALDEWFRAPKRMSFAGDERSLYLMSSLQSYSNDRLSYGYWWQFRHNLVSWQSQAPMHGGFDLDTNNWMEQTLAYIDTILFNRDRHVALPEVGVLVDPLRSLGYDFSSIMTKDLSCLFRASYERAREPFDGLKDSLCFYNEWSTLLARLKFELNENKSNSLDSAVSHVRSLQNSEGFPGELKDILTKDGSHEALYLEVKKYLDELPLDCFWKEILSKALSDVQARLELLSACNSKLDELQQKGKQSLLAWFDFKDGVIDCYQVARIESDIKSLVSMFRGVPGISSEQVFSAVIRYYSSCYAWLKDSSMKPQVFNLVCLEVASLSSKMTAIDGCSANEAHEKWKCFEDFGIPDLKSITEGDFSWIENTVIEMHEREVAEAIQNALEIADYATRPVRPPMAFR